MNLKVSDAKREEGFTLIELLVVTIIIGILAAIAIPLFLRQREAAWAGSTESDTRNAAIQVETDATRAGLYTAPVAADLQLSTGVTLRYAGADADGDAVLLADDASNFLLCGEHVRLDNPTEHIIYSSATGGLDTEWTTGACPDAGTTWEDLGTGT